MQHMVVSEEVPSGVTPASVAWILVLKYCLFSDLRRYKYLYIFFFFLRHTLLFYCGKFCSER